MTLIWPGCDARAADPRAAGQLGLQVGPQPVRVGARLAEQPGRDAIGLVEQGEQQVLAVDLGVPEAQRLGLRVVQRFLRLLRQAVRVHCWPPVRRAAAAGAASSTAIRSSRSVTRPMAA